MRYLSLRDVNQALSAYVMPTLAMFLQGRKVAVSETQCT